MSLALGLALLSGCLVKVYQPMSGLHGPIVVDPRHPNLADTQLDVHCVPGDALNGQQASALCQKVGTLFENQGAVVRTHVSEGRDDSELREAPSADEAPGTALSLELRARRVHESTHPLSWVLCFGTFTVLPGVVETTFAQDVVIRDGSGFLLVTESLEGRLVTRFGLGPWTGNALANLARDEEAKLNAESASRDLSGDLYGQLSQLVFNAKIQAQVLEQAPAVGTGE